MRTVKAWAVVEKRGGGIVMLTLKRSKSGLALWLASNKFAQGNCRIARVEIRELKPNPTGGQ